MNARTKVLSMPRWHLLEPKILFFAFSAILLMLFGMYAYLVNTTVMNVVARERIEKDISALSTSLSSLEYKYITLKNSVTLDLAFAKGFEESTPTSFISSGSQAITYNSR